MFLESLCLNVEVGVVCFLGSNNPGGNRHLFFVDLAKVLSGRSAG